MPFIPDDVPQSHPSFIPDPVQGNPEQEALRQKLMIGDPRVDKGISEYTPEQLNNIQTSYDMGSSPVQMAAGQGLMGMLGKGAGKVGDYLMKAAVGAGKEAPGFGQVLAKNGLIGTKSMMAGQTEAGLQRAGQSIGDLSAKIPGTISQDPVANQIAELTNGRMSPSGFVRPEDKSVVDKILSKAQDFATAEPITGAEMASRRAIAGKAAREAGAYRTVPSQALKSNLASSEQSGYSKALKGAYNKAFPGDNALADADQSYSTLAKTKDYLDKPKSDLIDAVKNATLKGTLSSFIPTTFLQSVGGRAAIGAGNALQTKTAAQVPLTLEQLLGIGK